MFKIDLPFGGSGGGGTERDICDHDPKIIHEPTIKESDDSKMRNEIFVC